MKKLIDIDDLSREEVKMIWTLAESSNSPHIEGTIGWSFEGNGMRTRSSFIKAFQQLGLDYIELPNLLKTSERIEDLAGYLDNYFDLYVIRENDHERISCFADKSSRPVINAMSSKAHPCEVLTDAYYIHKSINSIEAIKILLWGPHTNVFSSWYSLAKVMELQLFHFCPDEHPVTSYKVNFQDIFTNEYDIIITDAWPTNFSDVNYSLSIETYIKLGKPFLQPTPPFTIGKEILFDPVKLEKFVGYKQKQLLVSVQSAILLFLLQNKI